MNMRLPPETSRLIRATSLFLLCLLALSCLCTGNRLSAQKARRVACTYCKDKGQMPCRKHSKLELALETDGTAEFCTEAASCKTCGGTLHVDCTHCENSAVEATLMSRREKIQKWYAARKKKVDELVKHPVLQASGKHVDLVWDLKAMKVGRKKLSSHEMLHLYLKRMEDLRADFVKRLQIGSAEQPARIQLFCWRDGRDQFLASHKFAGSGSQGTGIKYMGSTAIYTMQWKKKDYKKDEDLHRSMVHNSVHLMLANMTPSRWIGQLKGGWIDEGLAHYFEFLLDGECSTRCFQEVMTDVDFKAGKWRVPIRRKVSSGRIPKLADVIQRNTDQFDGTEHLMAFSYVHFLLEGDLVDKNHGKEFVRLVRVLKAKKPAREALRKVYSLSPVRFEEKWKEWVQKTYPAR
jgi:hypothetical protein